MDTIYREIEERKRTVDEIKINQGNDHEMLVHHDKILVRGNGIPSLQEVVRNLSRAIEELVEEHRADKKSKKEEIVRWKWTLIGLGLPAALTFIGQAIIFWVRIAPSLLDK